MPIAYCEVDPREFVDVYSVSAYQSVSSRLRGQGVRIVQFSGKGEDVNALIYKILVTGMELSDPDPIRVRITESQHRSFDHLGLGDWLHGMPDDENGEYGFILQRPQSRKSA